MRARRALLYVPGDDRKKIQKATTLDVDCICLDMEDGVAMNRKAEARQTISETMKSMEFGRSERLVRINAIGTGFEENDLLTACNVTPNGIILPKVEEAWQVRWLCERLMEYEVKMGWPTGGMRVIIQVESARGVINLQSIASADPRLDGIIFGAEDFANDIGATRTKAAWEVFYARSAVVTYCAAFGLQAIDMVYVDFQDSEGLRTEAEQGARMGFEGKQIIHPSQVEPVQTAFTPNDEAIQAAVRIIVTNSEHQKRGFGAFALDGKMVDAPVVKLAERVLEKAHAAGKYSPPGADA